MNCCGLLIRNARLEKNWSQEGLCKGICSVPYLSKIEQGKAEPSEEIAGALFARLGFTAVLEKDFSAFAEKLRDSCLEAVQSYIPERLRSRLNAFESMLCFLSSAILGLAVGALGEILDYRVCLSFCAFSVLIFCLMTVWKNRSDVKNLYESVD